MDNAAPNEDDPYPEGYPSGSLLRDYLTRVDAAAAIGMSAKSLDRLHYAARGPPRTIIAGRIFYRIASLQTWLLELEDAE